MDLSNIFATLTRPTATNELAVPTSQPTKVPSTVPKDQHSSRVPRESVHKNLPHLIPPDPEIAVQPSRVLNNEHRATIIPYDSKDLSPPTHGYNLRKRPQACAVVNSQTGKLEEYGALAKGPDKDIWEKAYANDLGRLAKGVKGRIEGTNMVFFISHNEVPTKKR